MQLSKRIHQINDDYMKDLKDDWFSNYHELVAYDEFVPIADEWFKSSKLNTLDGWDKFDCKDVIMGCTHYIENFIIKHGWDGFQILPDEYAYYGLMGKFGNEPGDLEEDKPMIVSLPNWRYGSIRPDWEDVLRECEKKNIDIHIDFAWYTVSKDINIDLSHPNIKSFAMSMSKYSMAWNRIGLRWCKQRSMDSIAVMNKYYGDVNSALTSCGAYMMQHMPIDYGWETYRDKNHAICNLYNLTPTDLVHVVIDPKDNQTYGIADALVNP
jgi:hypothetical protein